MRPFVPLNVHTHYSLLEAASKVSDIVQMAKEANMPAVAITDSGVMYGAIELYNAAKSAGIKPILGCELAIIEGDIEDKSTRKPATPLVLLAKNEAGYSNLTQLVSTAQLKGFYYRPRINWELLDAHREGLIALSGSLGGPLAYPLVRGQLEAACQRAEQLKDLFGEDFFIEIQDHGMEAEYRFSQEASKLAQELHIPLVITNNSHFSRPEDQTVHEILLCMQQGKTLHDPARNRNYGPEYYFKNGDQMLERFQHLDRALVETALDNTLLVAERCNLNLKMGESLLPDFPLPEGVTAEQELRHLVETSTQERYPAFPEEVRERMDFELNIINQMGFPTYFLIVWDFMNYARKHGVPVGPGRGSAAGSLVAYVLGITNIDPIEHNLLFERFLNPERVSMPDIDIDFCIERREEVIQYVTQRYGQDRVCQIGTFGTLAARAAVKAVARVTDIPYADSDRIAKMIPAIPGTKLKDALGDGMELQKAVENDPKVKEWIDLALKMEGTVCNVGVHAAGVVIAKDPLSLLIPLQRSKDGNVVSQYTMGDLEKLGLLKMDFLGLRNLTIINNTVNLVEKGHQVTLDMDHLPLNDGKVFSILSAGDTDGVFQLESGGMKALVKDLKPTVFEDINALVALYRPGPLNSGMVKTFVDRKHGRAEVEYKHPALEPILNATYGTIVYQEQIMQIAQSLAGYSLGQADLLRRAMGKKKADVMAKEKDSFVQGAVANHVDETLATELFDIMSEFAAYCFNRSHSAAYAMVSFQTAYLKAHYPVEYLSALLSSVRNDLDKIQHYMITGRRMGIKILPPDVTKSGLEFTPDNGAIRFGLASIKNVGVGVVETILKTREEAPFESLEDFCRRIDPKVLNRKTLESLIHCGALESFGVARKQLFENVDTIIRFAEKSKEQRETGQSNLFDLLAVSAASSEPSFGGLMLSGNPKEEYDDSQLQQLEKELLGFYVSSHPLDPLFDTLPLMVSHRIQELPEVKEGTDVVLGGLLSHIQHKVSKSNRPLCVGQLEDIESQLEFVAFSDTLERVGDLIGDGQKVLLSGQVQFRGDSSDTPSLIVKDIRRISAIQPLTLQFNAPPPYEDIVYLGQLLAQNGGNHPVILGFPDGTRVKTGMRFWVSEDRDRLEKTLKDHFGEVLQVG